LLSANLAKQVAAGNEILNRLSQIALAARPSSAEAAPASAAPPAATTAAAAPKAANAKALLAAAQAFSDRRKATGLAA